MKKIIYPLLSVMLIACGDFNDINLNPDTPTMVTPDFLATRVILNTTDSPASKWLFGDSWLMKSTGFTEHMEWYMYNKFERGNYDAYAYLIDTKKMVDLVHADQGMAENKKQAYEALDYFMQALVFYNATMAMGDVPCSEALKGESEGIVSPQYNTQEEVFGIILKNLQKSSELFGSASAFDGDFIYNGNPVKWQRATNSFMLRLLNMLSKKQTVAGIDIRNLFEKTAASPLIESEADSYQRTYDAGKSSQWYPFYHEKQNFWPYPVFTSFFVNMLKDLQDYRLFYFAEPAKALTADMSSFDAYSGVNPVLEYGQIQAEFAAGKHSTINKRYHRMPQGEPVKFIAYTETQFILAEAALRGWKTPGSAKEHYEKGVRAAMKFTAEHTPEAYRHGRTIDDAYIDGYLKGKAAFNETEGLKQIMIQKYIASFVQLPFNSYYDYRRTGYPELPLDPATNMNEIKTQYPVRWMYPENEYERNKENVENAIKRQFNGTDTPNDVMWLLK